MPRETNYKNRVFLKINAEGRMYVSSKEPKEGYEEVKLKDGSLTYHKFYSGTEYGKISLFSVVKTDNGKYLNLGIDEGEVVSVISMPIWRTAKSGDKYLNPWVIAVISVMPNIDFQKEYRISTSVKNYKGTDNKEHKSHNVWFNYMDIEGNELFEKFAISFKEAPAWEKSNDGFSETYDKTKFNAFWSGKLQVELDRFKQK